MLIGRNAGLLAFAIVARFYLQRFGCPLHTFLSIRSPRTLSLQAQFFPSFALFSFFAFLAPECART